MSSVLALVMSVVTKLRRIAAINTELFQTAVLGDAMRLKYVECRSLQGCTQFERFVPTGWAFKNSGSFNTSRLQL